MYCYIDKAAAGGTGQILARMCKLAGATVIGTTSSEEKKEKALQAGCDHVILYPTTDVKEAVMEITST